MVFSVLAFADTATTTGRTNGGTAGVLNVPCSNACNRDNAIAITSVGHIAPNPSPSTNLTWSYLNVSTGFVDSRSASGTVSVTVNPAISNYQSRTSASTHRVSSSAWGSWSGSLNSRF